MTAAAKELIDRLELQPSEINCLRLSEKDKSGIPNSKRCSNLLDEQNLRSKLRVEARLRMLKHKLESLPSDEDIEIFCINLRNNSTTSKDDADKFIDYSNYKKTLMSAPKTIRDFLTTKIFMDLLHSNNSSNSSSSSATGHVPIDSIADYLILKKDKLSKFINLQYYDTAGKGYLSVEDLQDYLKGEVLPHIPSLSNLNDEEPMLLDYYLCMATRKFFFLLDTMRQKKIRIVDVVASRLLEDFDALREVIPEEAGSGGSGGGDNVDAVDSDDNNDGQGSSSKTNEAINWFSKENCIRIKDLYRELDKDDNGLLSISEMSDFQRITNTFMQRVFQVQQTYDNDELDLRGFCDLLLAMENKSDRSALIYYFRVLDVDGDNLLSASDLQYFYRDLARMLEDCLPEDSSQKAPPFEVINAEIRDMCHSNNSEGITLKELIACGKGGTVVGMLTDLDAFLEYENREDIVYEE